MPVGAMLQSMSSREFSEWMAFHRIKVEEQKKAELAMKAKSGAKGRRAKR